MRLVGTIFSILLLLALSTSASAFPPYVADSNNAIIKLLPSDPTASLPPANACIACHIPPGTGPALTPFGTATVAAALGLGHPDGKGSSWNTPQIFDDIYGAVINNDSDGDTVSNSDEFIGQSNPGDPDSTPSNTTVGSGNDGPLEFMEQPSLGADNSGDGTLSSGCAVATINSTTDVSFKASLQKSGWSYLLLLLPLALIALFYREPKKVPVRTKERNWTRS